jgi:protein tyrosine/serine phosphatase
MIKYLIFALLLISSVFSAEPRVRPANWGQQVIGTKLNNLYLIDKGVYRSEQPEHENVNNLKLLGIKEVLNLRELHSDKDDLKKSNFLLKRIKMDTGDVSENQIIDALRIIKNRKGSILIHCWHGSDRTGVTAAAYRLFFNNWSKAQAIDEMINGGYGYHSRIYPKLILLLEKLNITKIKKELKIDI